MLVSKTIPNLINGVSQQPDSLRFATQCAAQENAYPSVVDGLAKRLPTEHLLNTGITGDAKTFVHTINRDQTERYSVIIRDGTIQVFDLINLDEETVDIPDGATYLDTDNADTAFRAVTIADVTFIVNTEKSVAMASDATPSSVNTYEAMIFIQQGTNVSVGGEYQVILDDGTTETTVSVDGSTATDTIAGNFATSITAISSDWTATSDGHIVYIENTALNFTITSKFKHGDNYISTFKDSTQRFSELPTHAKDGYIIKIESDPTETIDDYYVKFVTKGEIGGIGEGIWEECAAPALASGLKLDASTMPHILIRQADLTEGFVFKKADGSTHDSYDYSTFSWGNRLVGDLETNTDPSFVGSTINDVFLFKNRMGLLSSDNVNLSESGEFFNFFRTTVVDLLDTAPIDVASAHNKVAIFRHAIPYVDKLVLFSDTAQFILEGEPILSPHTVSLTHSTSYDSLKNCTPMVAGGSLMFAFNRGSFSGLREYFPKEAVENLFGAADVTSHTPQYIPGEMAEIAVATHENVVVCRCDGDTDALYIYNYHDAGNERLQSAWHRFEFGTDAKIIGIEFIETTLYITVYRSQGVFIEKLAFETGKADTGSSYVSRLDRRVTYTGHSDNWDASTGAFTITLPYKKKTRNIEVITSTGIRFTPTVDDDATTFTVSTNLTDIVFYVGEAYEMTYQMSDVTLKEPSSGGGRAVITDSRAQLRYGTLVYADSSYFSVEVAPDYRDTSYHKFTGRILGSGNMKIGEVPQESGEFRFPVFSKADQVTITIKNDTPLPSNLMSAEFELNWSPRAKRIGL
jgi:hypothetical protein